VKRSQTLLHDEAFVSPRSAARTHTPLPADAVRLSGAHDTFREGARIGLVVGASTWLWVALVDVIVHQPFHTFEVLGGMPVFTVVHLLLTVAYGIAIVSVVHGAVGVPSLIYGLGFGVLFLEIAFAFLTVMLASTSLGDLAWVRIFGGSVIGASIALRLVAQRHPLTLMLRLADEES
jgi:hypothetical protein